MKFTSKLHFDLKSSVLELSFRFPSINCYITNWERSGNSRYRDVTNCVNATSQTGNGGIHIDYRDVMNFVPIDASKSPVKSMCYPYIVRSTTGNRSDYE